jgi:siroheme decarboxylase
MQPTDDFENVLARRVQEAVPLQPRPFEALAETLGTDEGRVLEQLRTFRDDGRLREISAVLEGEALGYESALVAGRVPPERMDEVGALVSAHPTVSHCYVRRHQLNLWFTIAVPRTMGLVESVLALGRLTGISFHPLRRRRTYKIGVNFDLERRKSLTEAKPLFAPTSVALDDETVRALRALQTPLPLEPRPFRALAEIAGLDEDRLLAIGRAHLGNAMRRYVATFRHRRLGVSGNGMSVWVVPEARLDEAGARLAARPEVSHCYARETLDAFPYGLYGMMHGPDEAAVLSVAEDFSKEMGLDTYLVLFSTEEIKKCRLRYFLPELDAWWRMHGREAA